LTPDNDLNSLSESLVWWIYRNFKVNYCALLFEVYEERRGEYCLVCRGSILNGEAQPEFGVYRLGEGYSGWIAANNATLYLTDQGNLDSYEFDYYEAQYGTRPQPPNRFCQGYPHIPFKSYLGVPVTDGKEVLAGCGKTDV
jgi:hypothetical protein